MAQIFLTSTGTNNWTVPSDFSAVNTVDTIGSGGGGGTTNSATTPAAGGGGGGWRRDANISLTPGTTVSYTIDPGGINQPAGSTSNGGDGGSTSFGSLAAVTGGKGGGAGGVNTGGTGGTSTGGTFFTGGTGSVGSGSNSTEQSGSGGGAAGLNGNGNNAAGIVGGSGDAGFGGAGGNATNGSNGTEYDASHGSGGGGGGGSNLIPNTAGSGGNYGAGSGGGRPTQASAAGIQGLIVVNYTSAFTAARYWVGGTGNWDASTTTHWSTASGGAGGASVPTSSNDVVFDFNSGTGTTTITATATCRTVNSVNFTGTLNLGSQTLNLTGTGSVWNVSGMTIVPATSTIKLTDASSSPKTFSGLGLAYNNLYITGVGTGPYTVSGSNTFNDFKVDTPPHTVNFSAGSTQSIVTFTVNGTPGNLMTLQSTVPGVAWSLHALGTTISCDYLSIQDSHVN